MKRLLVLTVLALIVAMVGSAQAIPNLQLEIIGGSYVNGTYINNSDPFTLRAYLVEFDGGGNALNANLITDTYYISAALVPKQATEQTLGSFDFDGITYNATGTMQYGTPPIDELYPNLPDHGIYETYYKEFSFQFIDSNYVSAYNVADPTETQNVKMYFADFAVDISNLTVTGLHFDLYNENLKVKRNGTDYSTQFAPFSHDAEGHKVPEPSMLLLFGSGLIGLGFFGRKKFRK